MTHEFRFLLGALSVMAGRQSWYIDIAYVGFTLGNYLIIRPGKDPDEFKQTVQKINQYITGKAVGALVFPTLSRAGTRRR